MQQEILRPSAEPAVGAPRRAISLVGAAALLGVLLPFSQSIAGSAAGAALLVVGFGAAMLLVVLVCTARTPRRLDRVDLGVVLVAAVAYLAARRSYLLPGQLARVTNDETYLGHFALRTLLAGGDPYRADYPQMVGLPGGTTLFDGSTVTRYGYPPLTLELGAVLHAVRAPLGEPWVVAALALVAALLIAFLVLPRTYRVAVVPLLVGFGLVDSYVARGFPVIVALPFLVLVAWRWTEIGAGGRLGRRGVLQACALGFAITAHQLAWFVAPFVVVAVVAIRWRELPPRRALAVGARVAGIAAAVFLLLDLPFIVAGPAAWLAAVTTVLTQHALPYGVGVVALTISLLRSGGGFALYGVASMLAVLGLLAVTALRIRRVAAAVAVFPALVFLVSARSNATYLVSFTVVWLVWATAVTPAALARMPEPLLGARRGPGRWIAPALLLTAAAVAVVALLLPAPLALHASPARTTASGFAEVTVTVTNRSGSPVTPHFTLGRAGAFGKAMQPVSGSGSVRPGETTQVVLMATQPGPAAAGARVYAISSAPEAFSSAPLGG